MRPRLPHVLLMLPALPVAALGQGVSPPDTTLFAYDVARPLDVRDSVLGNAGGVAVHGLSYVSPLGGRVTALLVLPNAPGVHPAVLFGHWGYGNKAEFLPEAELYARVGIVSLLVDYPWVRPAPWRREEGPLDRPEVDREVHRQAVIDLRRGLDVLASRPDVDTARLGYVGHSYGAQWGAILSAIEPRLKAVVLMAGVPDDRALLVESQDPRMVSYRSQWTAEQMERYLTVNGPLEAIRYVGLATATPLLMQFGRFEPAIPLAASERYARAARDPKTVLWYDTGHALNDPRALFDRAAWLTERLGAPPVAPEIRRLLAEPR